MAATTTGGNPLRIVIVYDKQANATAPSPTDVFLSNDYLSQNNLNNRDHFTILQDYISDPIAAQGDFCVNIKFYKKMNLETMFNAGNAGTIGDISSGSLYMFFAQAGTTATAASGFSYNTRVRFLDN